MEMTKKILVLLPNDLHMKFYSLMQLHEFSRWKGTIVYWQVRNHGIRILK